MGKDNTFKMSGKAEMYTLTKRQRRQLPDYLRKMYAILVGKYWWYLNRFDAKLDVQTALEEFQKYESHIVDLVKAEVASKKKHHLAMLNIFDNMLPKKTATKADVEYFALVALDDYIV